MKLTIEVAMVAAVTPLMLKHGSGEDATLVPASSLTLKGEVAPKQLEELREGLSDIFFEKNEKGPRVPSLPELGAQSWQTEFEDGTLKLDLEDLEDLDFEDEELAMSGVELKSIAFEPLKTGRVDFSCNAIVRTDDAELRGKLNALLRHKVGVSFSKLTQKPLAAPKKPSDDAASANQGNLLPAPATQH